MNNKSKLFLAFGLGAMIGGALVALYSTDEGKAIVKKTKDQMGDLAGDLKKLMEKFQEDVAGFANTNETEEDSKA
jgi:hypothetical protein